MKVHRWTRVPGAGREGVGEMSCGGKTGRREKEDGVHAQGSDVIPKVPGSRAMRRARSGLEDGSGHSGIRACGLLGDLSRAGQGSRGDGVMY